MGISLKKKNSFSIQSIEESFLNDLKEEDNFKKGRILKDYLEDKLYEKIPLVKFHFIPEENTLLINDIQYYEKVYHLTNNSSNELVVPETKTFKELRFKIEYGSK